MRSVMNQIEELREFLTGLFDQLNPFNTGNLVLYFTWLILFTFTAVAVWRCRVPWLRLICYLLNQVFSIGFLLSWTLTGLLAYNYWQESIAIAIVTAAASIFLFRARYPWQR